MKFIRFSPSVFILILFLISCSKENIPEPSENLLGVWFEEDHLEDFNRISRVEYRFIDDTRFEVLRIELDDETGNILGYRYKSTGNYTIEGNQLTFSTLDIYQHDDTKGPYSDLNDLVYSHEESSYTVTYELEDANSTLVFTFPPCGEFANCITTMTLLKA